MTDLILKFITGAIWWLLVPLVCYATFTVVFQKLLDLTWRAESVKEVILRILFGAVMVVLLGLLLFLVFGAGHVVLEFIKHFYPTP